MSVTVSNIVGRLERLPYSRWHVKARAIVGMATFFDAFDAMAIAYVLPVILGPFHMTFAQAGLVVSSGYLGQMLGAVFFGWYAERHGRLRALQYTILLYSVFSLLCMFSWDFTSIFTLRLIQGIGLGAEVPIGASYINEMGKAKGRGTFFMLYESLFAIGLAGAALIGYWVVPNLGWQYMFLIGAIPAIIALPLRKTLPESPRWLAGAGRLEEADRTVSRLEQLISKDGTVTLPAVVEVPSGLAKKTRISEVLSGFYRRRTLAVWVLWFVSFFVLNTQLTLMPTIYTTVFKTGLVQALQFSVIATCSSLLALFTCAFLIDKTGRRRWFVGAFALGAVAAFLLAYVGVGSVMLVFVLSTICTSFGVGPLTSVLFLYTPEIYPTRMRAFATGIGNIWRNIASIVGPGMVGFVMLAFGLPGVFVIFGVAASFAAIVAWTVVVETSSRVLEDVSP